MNSARGYDKFLNNKLQGSCWTAIMDNGGGNHHTIMYNDFSGAWGAGGGHAWYSDKGSVGGYNEFAYNRIHDTHNGNGCYVKTNNNKIHDNIFINNTDPSGAPAPIRLFSELSGYTANDNEIARASPYVRSGVRAKASRLFFCLLI